jgi:2-dehydro-3-deoxyphosphogluconate aldolase/(4S)-4-hydroxy-2-oxoglutarate aldolase
VGITIDQIVKAAPVVPVIVIDDLADAVPLATALFNGGLKVLEITLRTECALAAITAMKDALPQITFCPTGGINLEKAPTYLKLPSVHCVGGSWMCPADLVKAKDWAEIEKRAREAASLGA